MFGHTHVQYTRVIHYCTNTHTHTQKSVGTSGGLLQKRVDDLERNVKRLEEEKSSLKQENASLVSDHRIKRPLSFYDCLSLSSVRSSSRRLVVLLAVEGKEQVVESLKRKPRL